MSGLLIQTTNSAFYVQTTTLEGVLYTLSFQYNQRVSAYYLSIADANGVDIYNGVKLICNQRLLRKCADPRKPPGDFWVISSTNDNSPPQLNDLVIGTGRCSLFYFSSDWVGLMTGIPPGSFSPVGDSATVPTSYNQVGIILPGDLLSFNGGSPSNPYQVSGVTASGISLANAYVAPANGGTGPVRAIWNSPSLSVLQGRILQQVQTNTTTGTASTYGSGSGQAQA
jgi:hypothetical protein